MKEDKVNPSHYNKYDYQPIDFTTDIFHSTISCYLVGNAVKYIARHLDKDGVTDLKKAAYFLDRVESEPHVNMDKVREFIEQLRWREAAIIENIFINLDKARADLKELIDGYDKYMEIIEEGNRQVKGYHVSEIEKGQLGKSSKILEEVNELIDAENQACKIMQFVECSDIFGALEAYINNLGLDMNDLSVFSNITKRAFENGGRN